MADRWLDREAAADYISVRVEELRRLLRAGKLPPPSYHLGPRSPRWWSATIDEAFGGAVASREPKGAAGLAEAIRQAARPRRSQAAR